MKPDQFLFLVLVAIILWPSNSIVPLPSIDTYTLYAAEGMVAIQTANGQKSPTPIPNPDITKCDCGGDGRVPTPDGVSDMKCKCVDCKCQKEGGKKVCPRCGREDCPGANSGEKGHVEKEPTFDEVGVAKLDQQILFFTSKTCGPCQAFKNTEYPVLKEKNWMVGVEKLGHVREMDHEENIAAYNKYAAGQSLPCFVKLRAGQVVETVVGYRTALQIGELWYKK